MSTPRLVLVTFPDAAIARSIAAQCVGERLAACANLLPGVESIYRWQGKVEEAAEVLVFFKTTVERYPALESRLRELHPYEVPEIVALELTQGLPDYLAWIAAETTPESAP